MKLTHCVRTLTPIFCLAIVASCEEDKSSCSDIDGNAQLPVPRTILARGELLAQTRTMVHEGNVYLLPACNALLKDADSVMRAPSHWVIEKRMMPPSGDKHDYMSMAPYWWPDPAKSNGLPYIQRDGEMNPDSRKDHDGLRFQRMVDAVEALSLAWYLSGEEDYTEHAVKLLRGWFMDPDTRMNPNLRYAQAIPGVSDGRGIGLIDLRHVPQLMDAVRILEMSDEWKPSDRSAFLQWWRQYLHWLRTSKNGLDERATENNHGTWFDSQAAALALFVGDSAYAREIFAGVPARIGKQILRDGSQPLELARTRPIHYTLFNLDPFTELAEMGRHVGVDLWNYTAPDGGSIVGALRFVAPFADTSHKWSKPDIVPVSPDEIAVPMFRAVTVTADTAITRAAITSSSRSKTQRWRLVYPGRRIITKGRSDSLYQHALQYARLQLISSATSLNPDSGFPRSTRPDGSWSQVPSNQWTSGFFAGTLWYMLQLTRQPVWRSLAERWTAGMEKEKSNKGTHDLGFMIFDSFGHGFTLTGNPHYRAVVVEASRSLASRYNSRVGAIKSWDTERVEDPRRVWKYPVIVDNLMNLEMLFQTSKADRRFYDIAERHARTSALAHVRKDGSTAHVALFDPVIGNLEKTATWQGYADNSSWARGQAWALRGLTASYGYTHDRLLLDAAERVADYFIAHLPPDGVPYWDLVHPAIPNTYRDASAAAIAASGLFDLSRKASPGKSQRYRAAAEQILTALSSGYLTEGTSSAAILAHSVGNLPQNGEIDVGIVYADYFFVEALLRQRGIYWP